MSCSKDKTAEMNQSVEMEEPGACDRQKPRVFKLETKLAGSISENMALKSHFGIFTSNANTAVQLTSKSQSHVTSHFAPAAGFPKDGGTQSHPEWPTRRQRLQQRTSGWKPPVALR